MERWRNNEDFNGDENQEVNTQQNESIPVLTHELDVGVWNEMTREREIVLCHISDQVTMSQQIQR